MMASSRTQAINVLGLLFGVCVTFWASNLASYLQSYPHPTILRNSGTGKVVLSLDDYVRNDAQGIRSSDDVLRALLSASTSVVARYDGHEERGNIVTPRTSFVLVTPSLPDAIGIKWLGAAEPFTSLALHVADRQLVATPVETTKACEIEIQLGATSNGWLDEQWRAWSLTLLSGLLFLLDILCVLWWFSKYVYQLALPAALRAYFVDFSIVGSFALAANSWDKTNIFLAATLVGSLCLLVRGTLLYRDPDALVTDKRLLRRALWLFILLALILAAPLVAFMAWQAPYGSAPYRQWIEPLLPGALSLIGVAMTLLLRDRIQVALDIREAARMTFVTRKVVWPREFVPGGPGQLAKHLSRQTRRGLDQFNALFSDGVKQLHDRLRSRVHPEGDLQIQGYILALTSHRREQSEEVENKAYMVAASHWLDDLLDGRCEHRTMRVLQRNKNLSLEWRLHEPRGGKMPELFERLFRRSVSLNSNDALYERLCQGIFKAAPLEENIKYLLVGLTRVAIGSVLFSPRLTDRQRRRLLNDHNSRIKSLLQKNSRIEAPTEAILDELGKSEYGKILLGLTTKTTYEISMASEGTKVDYGLAILYSVLFAPLLYFHDLESEIVNKEMVPLDAFDVDYEQVVPLLVRIKTLCESCTWDPRCQDRIGQLEMAFGCFRDKLPDAVVEALEPIYVPLKPVPTPVRRGDAPSGAHSESIAQ